MTTSPKGITAIVIDGITATAEFQDRMFDHRSPVAGEDSYVVVDDPRLGKISGMILDFGRNLGSSYVWLDAPDTTLSSAKLFYRMDSGPWQEAEDSKFPYEFSIPLQDHDRGIQFRVEGVLTESGERIAIANQLLKRSALDTRKP